MFAWLPFLLPTPLPVFRPELVAPGTVARYFAITDRVNGNFCEPNGGTVTMLPVGGNGDAVIRLGRHMGELPMRFPHSNVRKITPGGRWLYFEEHDSGRPFLIDLHRGTNLLEKHSEGQKLNLVSFLNDTLATMAQSLPREDRAGWWTTGWSGVLDLEKNEFSFPAAVGRSIWATREGDILQVVGNDGTNLLSRNGAPFYGERAKGPPLLLLGAGEAKSVVAVAVDIGILGEVSYAIDIVDRSTAKRVARIPTGKTMMRPLLSPDGSLLFLNYVGRRDFDNSSFSRWIIMEIASGRMLFSEKHFDHAELRVCANGNLVATNERAHLGAMAGTSVDVYQLERFLIGKLPVGGAAAELYTEIEAEDPRVGYVAVLRARAAGYRASDLQKAAATRKASPIPKPILPLLDVTKIDAFLTSDDFATREKTTKAIQEYVASLDAYSYRATIRPALIQLAQARSEANLRLGPILRDNDARYRPASAQLLEQRLSLIK